MNDYKESDGCLTTVGEKAPLLELQDLCEKVTEEFVRGFVNIYSLLAQINNFFIISIKSRQSKKEIKDSIFKIITESSLSNVLFQIFTNERKNVNLSPAIDLFFELSFFAREYPDFFISNDFLESLVSLLEKYQGPKWIKIHTTICNIAQVQYLKDPFLEKIGGIFEEIISLFLLHQSAEIFISKLVLSILNNEDGINTECMTKMINTLSANLGCIHCSETYDALKVILEKDPSFLQLIQYEFLRKISKDDENPIPNYYQFLIYLFEHSHENILIPFEYTFGSLLNLLRGEKEYQVTLLKFMTCIIDHYCQEMLLYTNYDTLIEILKSILDDGIYDQRSAAVVFVDKFISLNPEIIEYFLDNEVIFKTIELFPDTGINANIVSIVFQCMKNLADNDEKICSLMEAIEETGFISNFYEIDKDMEIMIELENLIEFLSEKYLIK